MAAPAPLLFAILVPLLAWRIYRRVRRNIGRQRSRAWRHWAGSILSPLILALFAVQAFHSPVAGGALLAGVAAGLALAAYALHLTRFECLPEGFFYTPNAYIGIGLSLLLVGRVIYRMIELYAAGSSPVAQGTPDFVRSPITLAIIGVVFGYYALYSAGLLRWRIRAGTASPG